MSAAWAAVFLTALLALLAAVWRAGSKVATLTSSIKELGRRLGVVEKRTEEHDDWHFRRLQRGVDRRLDNPKGTT